MSATKKPILTLSILSRAAIDANMPISHNGNKSLGGLNAIGFTAEAAGAGEMVAVDVLGTTIGISGEAVAIGVPLKSDATGKLIANDDNTGVTSNATIAFALQAATGADQKIEIFIVNNSANIG